MNVRRLIASLVVLAFILALGFPPGPAQAAARSVNMPCHSDAMAAPAGGETSKAEPSCCLSLCWLALHLDVSMTGARFPPTFVLSVSAYVSVAYAPRVPPPRYA